MSNLFKAAWWLPGPHCQTIWPTATRRNINMILRKQRLELVDGDFIDLVWSDNKLPASAPIVILLHGLAGGIESSYARGLLRSFNLQGWRGLLMHFRGCSGEPNRLDRSYHCGDTDDFAYLLKHLTESTPNIALAAVGISLGGNVLLKYLGEQAKDSPLRAAVAVSVPFDLTISANQLMQGFAAYYQRYLIKKLHRDLKIKFLQRPAPFDISKLDKWQSFWEFDNYVTAPLHGFNNVFDYYAQASSKPYLPLIETPTLLIHAKDDPFMTPAALPNAQNLSKNINFELSENGGHVGFITGNIIGTAGYWLESRIPTFLKQYIFD